MMHRILAVLTALAMPAALLVLAAAAPASAAGQIFTWIDDGNGSWTESVNWNPAGVPVSGDSVVINSGSWVRIADVPAISLANVTLAGSDISLNGAGPLTVTGSMQWTGGQLNMPLTIGPSATATIGAGALKSIRGDLTVQGTLALDHAGDSDASALEFEIPFSNGPGGDHDLVIQAGATVVSHGENRITSARCCGDLASAVVNQGSLQVPDGRLSLSRIGLDQHAAVSTGSGATLAVTKSFARLRDHATYAGPGSLALTSLGYPHPNVDHPEYNQDAALLEGTSLLSGGFHVVGGAGSSLTGVGTLAGEGSLDLAGSTVYGAITTSRQTGFHVTGPAISAVSEWNAHLAGYHGRLTLGGPSTIARGATLRVNRGTVTTVASGARLTVPAGATIAASSCCSAAATLVNAHGGSVVLGAGTGAPAKLQWTTLKNDGTLTVAGRTKFDDVTARQPGGTLVLTDRLISNDRYTFGAASMLTVSGPAGRLDLGGKATIAGRMKMKGRAPRSGPARTVVTAHRVTGRFACANTPGRLPTYSATAVRLKPTGTGNPAGCVQAVKPRKRTNGKVGVRATRFTVPFGKAKGVLLEITARHQKHASRVEVAARHGGHASIRVKKKGVTKRYVVVKVAGAHRFTVHTNHGTAKVRVRYVARYR